MANTPEGRVKKMIDAVLKDAPQVMWTKPVVGPYGSAMLDYEGCSKGRFFAIEAKAPTVNKPTERQGERMEKIQAAGGVTFFVNGKPEQLDALREWLHS